MIYLLEIDNTKQKGIISRLFSRGMDMSYTQADGAVICKITAKSENRIDWMRLEATVGNDDIIVISKLIDVPIEVQLNRPDCERARSELLLDGALKLIRQANKSGARLNILLADKQAEYGEYAVDLASICKQVCVLSEQNDKYFTYAERALGEHGTPLIILADSFSMPDCDIIIAPHGISGCGALPLPRLIFAPFGSDCVRVSDGCIKLPEIFDGIDTQCYDKFALADALSSCRDYSGKPADTVCMKWRDKILPLGELASIFYA